MFVIAGGSYDGDDFSCMFESTKRYELLSPNQRFYFQWGIKMGDDCCDEQALLVFDTEGDGLVYATTDYFIDSEEDYEKATKELVDNLPFLSDPTLYVDRKLNCTYKEVVFDKDKKEFVTI